MFNKRGILFTALAKKEFVFRSPVDVRRFVAEIVDSPNKPNVFLDFCDERKHGRKVLLKTFDLSLFLKLVDIFTNFSVLQRLQDLIEQFDPTDATSQHFEGVIIPLINFFLHPEIDKPLYDPKRKELLLFLFNLPNFIDAVSEFLKDNMSLQSVSYNTINKWLFLICQATLEPRKCPQVIAIAKVIQQKEEVDSKRLASVLGLDSTPPLTVDPVDEITEQTGRVVLGATWAARSEPPGGRHDNDHSNFRDIQIMPTAEEILSEKRPYLPLSSSMKNGVHLSFCFKYLKEKSSLTFSKYF